MKYFLKVLTLSVLGLSAAKAAQAAGFQINEYSAVNLGRAFAGVGVMADDFSAIGYNPAGMSLNKTNGVQGTASWIRTHSDYKGSNGYGQTGDGHTNINRVVPSFFAQYRPNDKVTTGIGIYTPFGLATDYPNGWFAEMHGAHSAITVVDVSPSIAYRFNDIFSVGGAINIQYAGAHLTSSASDVSGDDWAAGYSLGLTLTPLKELRFGLSYRSKVSHRLKGDLDRLTQGPFTMTGDVNAKITTPEVAILSAAWDITDKWTLSGTARWTRWKRFDDLDINLDFNHPMAGPIHTTSHTSERWRNTGFYSLGLDYKANDKWTFRGGIGYDMTVIRSKAYRTPRIPDGRRFLASLGMSYTYKNMQFDAGYTHLFIYGGHARGTDSSNINNRPNIKYSSYADVLGVGFQYKF